MKAPILQKKRSVKTNIKKRSAPQEAFGIQKNSDKCAVPFVMPWNPGECDECNVK
jgi:hypothetical protein